MFRKRPLDSLVAGEVEVERHIESTLRPYVERGANAKDLALLRLHLELFHSPAWFDRYTGRLLRREVWQEMEKPSPLRAFAVRLRDAFGDFVNNIGNEEDVGLS